MLAPGDWPLGDMARILPPGTATGFTEFTSMRHDPSNVNWSSKTIGCPTQNNVVNGGPFTVKSPSKGAIPPSHPDNIKPRHAMSNE